MITLTILIPLTLALVEAIKKANFINSKYMPLIAIVIAIVLAVVTRHLGEDISEVILLGLMGGLSAVGLFEAGKGTYKGLTNKE